MPSRFTESTVEDAVQEWEDGLTYSVPYGSERCSVVTKAYDAFARLVQPDIVFLSTKG